MVVTVATVLRWEAWYSAWVSEWRRRDHSGGWLADDRLLWLVGSGRRRGPWCGVVWGHVEAAERVRVTASVRGRE